MKTKKIDIIKELPLIVGKTYITKTQIGEKFKINKIDSNKEGEQTKVWGNYERYENRPKWTIARCQQRDLYTIQR